MKTLEMSFSHFLFQTAPNKEKNRKSLKNKHSLNLETDAPITFSANKDGIITMTPPQQRPTYVSHFNNLYEFICPCFCLFPSLLSSAFFWEIAPITLTDNSNKNPETAFLVS